MGKQAIGLRLCWIWLASLTFASVLFCFSLWTPSPHRYNFKSLVKQSSLDDPFENGPDRDDDMMREIDPIENGSDEQVPPTPPRPSTPIPIQRSLPWKPKVRYLKVHTFSLSVKWVFFLFFLS